MYIFPFVLYFNHAPYNMKNPLLNLGDIQNNKMVCLISGPRVYMQNNYINIETHLSGIGKRAWRSGKKSMTDFYQGKARGGDQTEFHREGDRCSSWTSQEEWASQGRVGGESILGKGTRTDRVTETQNVWNAGRNEQVCVRLNLACMSSPLLAFPASSHETLPSL